MTIRKVYIGSVGPFLFDDTDDIDDEDGDFAGETQSAIVSDSSINADVSASTTASDILTKLLTVDGAGSNLDADKLDGEEGSYYGTAANVSTNASDIDDLETWKGTGVSGSFTTTDGKTVTVTNGLITGIV